jgi:hypothetical protein
VTATASEAEAAPPRRRRGGTLAWAAGTAAVALALFAGYLRQSRTVSVGSDGASQALQAWDLLHGNPLLQGWWMTDVSFYTTELPQYALVELARGLTADVIHVAGAVTYTLLVLTAALLARGAETGTAGRIRALLTAGIMLAPQLGPGTQTLVLSPDHTGTCVPVLLVLFLIDRGDRPPARPSARPSVRWRVPVVVWLGLTWTAVADAMTLFVAVVPLAVVCAVRLATGWGDRWRNGSLTVAAVLAVPAELAVTALIRAHGGWQVNGLRTALAGAGQLAGNARLAGQGLLELFGADVFAVSGGPAAALAVLHLAGVVLAAAGVLAAARGLFRRNDLVERVLLTGIVIDLAAYLAGVQAVNILSTREIVPVLPFAAVLAGRCLGDRLAAGHGSVAGGSAARGAASRGRFAVAGPALRGGLCAVLALYAAGLGYAAAQPAAAPQYADLAGWLRAHHLTAGLSGYHQANITTLASGGAVTLRPVTAARGGRLAAYTWNASAAWFDPASRTATFLVLVTPGAPGSSGLTAAQASATFGRPASRYRYQQYEILVWPRTTNLLDRLSATKARATKARATKARATEPRATNPSADQSGAPATTKHQ